MFKKGDLVWHTRSPWGLGVVVESPIRGFNTCKIRWSKKQIWLWVHTHDLHLVSRAKKNV